MNLFKKSFTLFSFLFLFVLSLTFISAGKAEATIAVTVTANNVANSLSVASGTSVRIDWDAPTATSCTNNFNSSTLTHDSYTYTASNNTSSPVSTTFTVTCSAPAYCSGSYIDQVDWNGENEFNWVAGTVYDGDGGGCGNCSQRGNLGYRVDTNINNVTQGRVEANWYNPTCVGTGFIGCSGSRWSDNAALIRSAYKTFPCTISNGTNITTQYECEHAGINRDSNLCTWNP